MKKFILGILLPVFLCALIPGASYASHIVGGELGYEYVSTSGNSETYKVTLTIYADCGTAPASYASLVTSTYATIKVDTGAGTSAILSNLQLPKIQPYGGTVITPVCPDMQDSTTCTGGTIIGVSMFKFVGNVTLPFKSDKFRFVFLGNFNNNSAGRSAIINNVVNASSTTLELYADLNNLTAPNNSPTFNSEPSPFFCLNVPTTYNVSASDPDGDNISYALVPGLSNENPLGYITPYTYTTPLATAAGTFNFNNASGEMSFTPNNANIRSVVVTRVTEKRNGVTVGSIMREMFFVTLADCANQAPAGPVGQGENYVAVDSSGIYTVCATLNQPFSFNIAVNDPEGDNVTVSYSGLPSGATLSIANNNTPNPNLHFNWQPSNQTPGTYYFYVTYSDDGCPLQSNKTITYQINVVGFPNTMFSFDAKEPCVATDSTGSVILTKSPVSDSLAQYIWFNNAGDTLKNVITTGNDTLAHMPSGTYSVNVTVFPGCSHTYYVEIPAPNHYVSFTTDTANCENTPITFTNTTPTAIIDSYSVFQWNYGDGTFGYGTNSTYSFTGQDTFTVKLYGTTHMGCVDSFERKIAIDSVQIPFIQLAEDSLCAGKDAVLAVFNHSSAQSFMWDFGNGWLTAPPADTFLHGYENEGIYNVYLKSAFNYCPERTDSLLVHVLPIPKVDIGSDTSICPGQEVAFKNSYPTDPGSSYLWNTGNTSYIQVVDQPGTYTLQVTDPYQRCYGSDEAIVTNDCYINIPNAFSPNGDGTEDYFFPRGLLTAGVMGFKMEIYNRWGQLIWKTEKPDGLGWDGKYGGSDQPTGVYVYIVDAVLKDGTHFHKTGNVTLVK